MVAVQAKLRPGHQLSSSAGFDKRLQIGGNLRRRKPVEPRLVSSRLELPFLDCVVQDKTGDSIHQHGNDAHLRNGGSPRERAHGRFAQNRVVFFEGTIGSLSSRAQSVQLPIAFRTSGDLKNKSRMLCNRNMRGVAKPLRTMRTVPVELEIGRKPGFHALLEARKGKPLSRGIKTKRWLRLFGQLFIGIKCNLA